MTLTGLTPLPALQVLSDRVIRVLGLNPGPFALQGTNTYVVGTTDERVLIDTGEGIADYIALLQQGLRNHADNARISRVLLSHWHRDHVGGLTDVCRAFPALDKTAYKYPDAEHDDQPAVSNRPGVLTVSGTTGHRIEPVADGDEMHLSGVRLRAVYTPGHTLDHMAFYLEEEESLFTGDCVLGEKTPVFEDLPVYLASLDKLLALKAKRLYPGHGPVVDGEDNVRAHLTTYLKHRMDREQSVVQLLASPSPVPEAPEVWTAQQLAAAIYPNVSETILLAATHGIMLHLLKLHQEKRVSVRIPAEDEQDAQKIAMIRRILDQTRLVYSEGHFIAGLGWMLLP